MITCKTFQQQILRLSSMAALCAMLAACGGGGDGLDDEESSQNVEKTIHLSWNAPLLRENGDPIDPSEIDYYEIKYKQSSASSYQTLTIDGGTMETELTLTGFGDFELIISATDKNGDTSAYTMPIFTTLG